MARFTFDYEFPYEQYPLTRGKIPRLNLRLYGRDGRVHDLFGVLNSGAKWCTFNNQIADSLGIVWDRGREEQLPTIGNSVGYIHRMNIQCDPMSDPVECEVAFSQMQPAWLNTIGRSGIFERLLIAIRESEEKVYIMLES